VDADAVVRLGREALVMVLLVGGPVLAVSTAVGLALGVLQAVTQIHEQSLVFVPKILAVLGALALLGPWMLATLAGYAGRLLADLPQLVR
jgi:flagellar biosynthetic protein FliQ